MNLTGKTVSTRRALEERPVEASAPCRIDSGGTWDIKALSLPLAGIQPVTVTVALDLRTRVKLLPFRENHLRLSSRGFGSLEIDCSRRGLPFVPPFGLFFAALAHFGFVGLEVVMESDSPVRSALGGSSTALTALIKALSILGERLGAKPLPPREILALGYQVEDGISGAFCGIQDQAAAVYGGVHLWQWRYGRSHAPYIRESLFNAKGCLDLSRHILVANSGHYHDSLDINRGWVEAFLSGRTRAGWIESNRATHEFAETLRDRDWEGAARALQKETAIRRDITPDALIRETQGLVDAAQAEGCGARFTGAGGGGAVWAIGGLRRIQALRKRWDNLLAPLKGGAILECNVDPLGVA
jgi:D-glycero-alpha-D-manno-heptose-7-phosphate kinase